MIPPPPPIYWRRKEIKEFDRVAVTRIRLSSHRLAIETGRWSRLPREERKCTCGEIQTERHIVNECVRTSDVRMVYDDVSRCLFLTVQLLYYNSCTVRNRHMLCILYRHIVCILSQLNTTKKPYIRRPVAPLDLTPSYLQWSNSRSSIFKASYPAKELGYMLILNTNRYTIYIYGAPNTILAVDLD